MGKLLDTLDHPLVFLIFMTISIVAMAHLLSIGASKAGMPAAASFFWPV